MYPSPISEKDALLVLPFSRCQLRAAATQAVALAGVNRRPRCAFGAPLQVPEALLPV